MAKPVLTAFPIQTLRFVYRSQSARERRFYSTSEDKSPLAGIRVIDLTRIVAGPYCTMILGDLGAEVLKIEEPGVGDQARKWGPFFGDSKKAAAYFVSLNRNKKSVCIDLKRGRDIIYDLAQKSDVLMENYIPGKLSQYGLSFEDIHKVAPHLIYCSLTGYGYDGPYMNRPGYDLIAASIGGLLHITGPKDGPPCRPGAALIDISAGLYAHGAIMAALLQRMKTKKGQWIQCNLLSTQLANLINVGSAYLNANQEARKLGSALESIVPYESFQTKDGWFTVGAGSDAQFFDLLKKMDMTNLDPKFDTNAERVKNREELLGIFEKEFVKKTNQEWAQIFEGSSFPFAPVNNMKDTFNDKHVKDIGIVKEVKLPTDDKVKIVGPAVTYSYAKNEIRSPPPKLGQHTIEVMKDILEYPEDSIKDLLREKEVPTVRLRLRKPRSSKKVQWTQGTVDNEDLNKKKSKCCCIYEKPKTFGESSSEDSDDECEHCHGHKDDHKKVTPINKNDTPPDGISHSEPIATGSV